MLDDGVLYVTGLAGLDRLRAVKELAMDHVSKFGMKHNACNFEVGNSPIMSRIDGAPILVLEKDGIRELMFKSRVWNPPILDRLVQVNPGY